MYGCIRLEVPFCHSSLLFLFRDLLEIRESKDLLDLPDSRYTLRATAA